MVQIITFLSFQIPNTVYKIPYTVPCLLFSQIGVYCNPSKVFLIDGVGAGATLKDTV